MSTGSTATELTKEQLLEYVKKQRIKIKKLENDLEKAKTGQSASLAPTPTPSCEDFDPQEIGNLRLRLAEVEQTLSERDNEIQRLQGQLQTLDHSHSQLKYQLDHVQAESEAEVKKWKQNHELLLEEMSVLEEEKLSHEEKLRELEEELKSWKKSTMVTSTDQEQEIQSITERFQEEQRKLIARHDEELLSQKDKLISQQDALQRSYEELTERYVRLEEEKVQLEERMKTQFQSTIDNLIAEKEQLIATHLDQELEQVERLKKVEMDHVEKMTALQEQISQLSQDLSEKNEMENQVEEHLKSQIAQLSSQLQAREQSIAQGESEKERLEEEIEAIRREFESCVFARDNLTEQLRCKEEDLLQLGDVLKGKENDWLMNKGVLEEEVVTLKTRLEALEEAKPPCDELATPAEDLVKENQTLLEKIETLQSEFQEKESEIQRLQGQLQTLDHSHSQLKYQLDHVQAESEAEVKKWKQNHELLLEEMSVLEEEKLSHEEKLRELEEEIKSYKQEVTSPTPAVNEDKNGEHYDEQIEQLQSQLQSQILLQEQEIQSITERFQEEQRKLIARHDEELLSQKEKLISQQDALQRSYEELTERYVRLEEEKIQLEEEVKRLAEQVKGNESVVKGEDQRDVMNTEVIEEDKKEMEQQLSMLKSQLVEVTKARDDLVEEINGMKIRHEEELVKKEDQVVYEVKSQLKEEWKERLQQHSEEEYHRNVTALEQVIEEQKEDLLHKDEVIAKLEDDIQQLYTTRDDLNQQLTSSEAVIADLRMTIDQSDSDKVSSAALIQSNRESWEKEKAGLEGQLAAAKLETEQAHDYAVGILNDNVEKLSTLVSTLEGTLAAKQSELEEKEQEVLQLEEKIKQIQHDHVIQLDSVKEDNVRVETLWQREKTILEEELLVYKEDLTQQIMLLREENVLLIQKVSDLQSILERQEKELQSRNQQIETQLNQITNLEEDCIHLKTLQSQHMQTIQELESQLITYQTTSVEMKEETVSKLEKTIQSLENDLIEARQQIDNIKSHNETEHKERLNELIANSQKREVELDELKSKLSSRDDMVRKLTVKLKAKMKECEDLQQSVANTQSSPSAGQVIQQQQQEQADTLAALEAARTEINKLKEQLIDYKKAIQGYEEKKVDYENRWKQFNESLIANDEKISNLLLERSTIRQEVIDIQERLLMKQKELDSMKFERDQIQKVLQEIESVNQQHIQQINHLTNQYQQEQDKTYRLEIELTQERLEKDKFKQVIEGYQSHEIQYMNTETLYRNLIQEKDQLAEKLQTLTSEWTVKEESFQMNQRKLKALLNKVNQLSQEKDVRLQQYETLYIRRPHSIRILLHISLDDNNSEMIKVNSSQFSRECQEVISLVKNGGIDYFFVSIEDDNVSSNNTNSGSGGNRYRWIDRVMLEDWLAQGVRRLPNDTIPMSLMDIYHNLYSALSQSYSSEMTSWESKYNNLNETFNTYKQRAQSALKRINQEDRDSKAHANKLDSLQEMIKTLESSLESKTADYHQLHVQVETVREERDRLLVQQELMVRQHEEEKQAWSGKLVMAQDQLKTAEAEQNLLTDKLMQMKSEYEAREKVMLEKITGQSLQHYQQQQEQTAQYLSQLTASPSHDEREKKKNEELHDLVEVDLDSNAIKEGGSHINSTTNNVKSALAKDENSPSHPVDHTATSYTTTNTTSTPSSLSKKGSKKNLLPHDLDILSVPATSVGDILLEKMSSSHLNNTTTTATIAAGSSGSGLLAHHQADHLLKENIRVLREENSTLMAELLDIRNDISLRDEQIDALKSTIRELEASLKREREFNASTHGLQVDYLVNVLRKFLLTTDPSERTKLVQVLCNLLHLSVDETRTIVDIWTVKPAGGLVGWLLPKTTASPTVPHVIGNKKGSPGGADLTYDPSTGAGLDWHNPY